MHPSIILIDNYDSFTWNLVRALAALGAKVDVHRNNEISVAEVLEQSPSHVVVSPGPGKPSDAGISKELIQACEGNIPVLGVCLGHQAIVEALGGKVVRAPQAIHGKSSKISHDGKGVFADLPQDLEVGRYHSLVAERVSLPNDLQITATIGDLIMGVRHKLHPIEGVQFHPESILTPEGNKLLRNFLQVRP